MNQNHYTEEQLAEGVKALEFCRNSAVSFSDETIAGLVYDHMTAASPAPPKQQPALGRGEGGGVPLSDERIRGEYRLVRTATGSFTTQETYIKFARAIERAHGIGKTPRPSAPTGQINPDSAGQEGDHG